MSNWVDWAPMMLKKSNASAELEGGLFGGSKSI